LRTRPSFTVILSSVPMKSLGSRSFRDVIVAVLDGDWICAKRCENHHDLPFLNKELM
jgi:hypothetical protein